MVVPAVALAASQASKFTTKEVVVISPANEFVAEASGTQIKIGGTLSLTRKLSGGAIKIRQGNFQIRVFRLPHDQFEPAPREFFDPCYVYLSKVYPFKGSDSEKITVGTLTSDTWLEPEAGGVMRRGRYLLVFEQLEDEREIFRISKDKKEDYFNSGLYLEVLPSREYSRDEIQRLAVEITALGPKLNDEIALNNASRPCYRYKQIRVAGGEDEFDVALLVPCDAVTLAQDAEPR